MRQILKSGLFAAAMLGCGVVAALLWPEHLAVRQRLAASPSIASVIETKPVPPERVVPVAEEFLQPAATVTDEELLRLARSVVTRSPAQALAWVAAQTDAILRQRMLVATLQGWGEADPCSAVNWVLMNGADERDAEMRAALTGAASQPATAMQIVRQLLVDDPDNGGAYAAMLAGSLSAEGKFQDAVGFINGAASRDMENSVNAVFNRWAQSQPQAAMNGVDAITDPELRAAAFRQVTATWNANDPAGLAAYGATLPAGGDRDFALNAAVQNWSVQDPTGLANWLNTLPAGGEFDAGVAAMIFHTDSANRPPDLAMQWVENISDPALRQSSLVEVVGEWNQADPVAARQYVENAPWLDEPQRVRVLKFLGAGAE
jgi:hypothetical protein